MIYDRVVYKFQYDLVVLQALTYKFVKNFTNDSRSKSISAE